MFIFTLFIIKDCRYAYFKPQTENMPTGGVPQLSHHALSCYFNPMSHSLFIYIYTCTVYTVSHKPSQVEYPILGRHFEIETSCFYLMVLKPETTKNGKRDSKRGANRNACNGQRYFLQYVPVASGSFHCVHFIFEHLSPPPSPSCRLAVFI